MIKALIDFYIISLYANNYMVINLIIYEKYFSRFLILATDGLWDFLSNEEAVEAVDSCKDKSTAADLLVTLALSKAAEECGMNIADLKQLPPGRQRRSRHDDTSVIVIYF